MLKICLPVCGDAIAHVINFSLTSGLFPDSWKLAQVTPLPKEAEITEMSQLRPISILPALSKVIERLVYIQLSDYVQRLDIIPSTQSGFRPSHSTATTLVDLVDDVLQAIDSSQVTVAVMLDYSKAFDSIDHKLLVAKLNYYGISGVALEWFRSYLMERYQMVKTVDRNNNVRFSRKALLASGVPQGSILGPLLYIIYTADLWKRLSCKLHGYADDCQLYISFNPSDQVPAFNYLNSELEKLRLWSKENSLHLNPSKTQAILFGTPTLCSRVATNGVVRIDNVSISFVSVCKSLGVLIDQHLMFSDHIAHKIKSAIGRLKALNHFRDVLPTAVKLRLTDAVILPIFDYCDVVYGPCISLATSHKIQLFQNTCMRYCTLTARRSHITPQFLKYGWVKMDDRRMIHYANFIKRITLTRTPSYLFKKLKFFADIHDFHTRQKLLLQLPRHSTAKYEGCFSFYAAHVYNNLSPGLRNTLSMHFFKSKLKERYAPPIC